MIRDLLKLVLDDAPFDEYKADYGRRRPRSRQARRKEAGIVANQKKRVKAADGPLYSAA